MWFCSEILIRSAQKKKKKEDLTLFDGVLLKAYKERERWNLKATGQYPLPGPENQLKHLL